MTVQGCGGRVVDKLGWSELYTPPLPLGVEGRETGSAGVGERGSRERNDKAYHSDGVAVLLLAAHCCLLSFSFSACSETQTQTQTRCFSNTRRP